MISYPAFLLILSISVKEYDAIKFEKRNHVFSKYQDEDMMKDPEQIFMRNVMKELKEGKVTPKSFDLLCSINGKSPETIRRKINNKCHRMRAACREDNSKPCFL